MTETADIDAMLGEGHTAPLDADAVPNDNQSHTCFSCHEPLNALYCGNCGQKNDDYRRPLWSLGKEAVASLTALENRIWRTWAALFFKPGLVAREYADGRRTHWSSPVRVYIFMSIALFFFMEITGTMFFALEATLNTKDGVPKPAAELEAEDVDWNIKPHFFPTQANVDSWNEGLNFDLFGKVMAGSADTLTEVFRSVLADGIDVDDVLEGDFADDLLEDSDGPLTVQERDALLDVIASLRETQASLRGTPGEAQFARTIAQLEARAAQPLADSVPSIPDSDNGSPAIPEFGIQSDPTGSSLQINGEDVRDPGTFLRDLIRNPEIVNNALNRWLPRIIFLMMPLTMLIGALFIRGLPRRAVRKGLPRGERRALLYDHLVHATYIHAVAYALLFLGIIGARLMPDLGGAIALSIVVLLMIYLPISLRRMFRRGWIKTVWTAYGVAFIHSLIVTILVTIAIGNALQDHFAT